MPLDDVRKRDAITDSRRIRIAAACLGVFAVLALVAGFLFYEHLAQERHLAKQAQEVTDTKALVEKLLSLSQGQAAPGAEKAVGTAVEAAVQGAAGGDLRLQRALELLKAGNVKDAEPLFRAVADEKATRISQDKKDAAAAYRNLGAIAGLGDPKRSREAYASALDFDGDDLESLYWHGYLNYLAGDLRTAERSLTRLRELATARKGQRGLYRAHLRHGEVLIDRGNLSAALEHERKAFGIASQKSQLTPPDWEWQRDLSVSHEKIGDVLVAQGNLPAALATKLYDRSRERLTQAEAERIRL